MIDRQEWDKVMAIIPQSVAVSLPVYKSATDMKLGNYNSNRGYKIDRWLTMIGAESMIEMPSIDRDTN